MKMIKRDSIQRFKAISIEDGQGGTQTQLVPAEFIDANVSVNTTLKEITQYGLADEMVIHVVTNIKLDEDSRVRYQYSNKLFKLTRQIKQGNEYYSTFIEVNKGGQK